MCGSGDVEWEAGGSYSYDHVYCQSCKTRYTFFGNTAGPHLFDTIKAWNERSERLDEFCCPFCGWELKYVEGYMFEKLYCECCRVEMEYQKCFVNYKKLNKPSRKLSNFMERGFNEQTRQSRDN